MGDKTGKQRAKTHGLKLETQAEIGAVAGKIRNKNQQAESTSVQPKKAACEEQNHAQPNIRNMHQNLTRKHKKPEKKPATGEQKRGNNNKNRGSGEGGSVQAGEVSWVGGPAHPPPIKRFAGWVVQPTPHP